LDNVRIEGAFFLMASLTNYREGSLPPISLGWRYWSYRLTFS
jgi:hypothetical protein